jgi:rhamnose utilization protein RhaD (predicted bifunctional aldolase and dehydrogenase)
VHIHCVETIAPAVREDASDRIAERLDGLEAVVGSLVPYRRPGLPLARAILEAAAPDANVLVLVNHGLVVSGDSVAEVESLMERVCAALAATPRTAPRANIAAIAD